MAIVQLDLTPDADGAPFQQLVELGGVSVYLRFRWNDRAGSWQLSVLSEDGSDLIGTIRIVNNWDLLGPFRADPRVPTGLLVASAQTEPEVDAGKAELGGRVGLFYIEDP